MQTGMKGFVEPRSFEVAFAQSPAGSAREGAQSSSGSLPSGAVPANARVTSPSAEQQPTSSHSASAASGIRCHVQPQRQQQQAPDWNGYDRLPDDDMQAQVRREVDEWSKSLYRQNEFLFKIPSAQLNDKRFEIRCRLWAERNRRRGFD